MDFDFDDEPMQQSTNKSKRPKQKHIQNQHNHEMHNEIKHLRAIIVALEQRLQYLENDYLLLLNRLQKISNYHAIIADQLSTGTINI